MKYLKFNEADYMLYFEGTMYVHVDTQTQVRRCHIGTVTGVGYVVVVMFRQKESLLLSTA
jgi:hypothetical protein